MIDSKAKGYRAEAAAKKQLIELTGLDWQRTPSSGALNKAHKMKGDLYLPDCKNKFCVEVKHYKESQFNTKILTDMEPQLLKWWAQTLRQAKEVDRLPLLLFKFDRSQYFVVFTQDALGSAVSYNKYRQVSFSFITENYNPLWGNKPVFIAKLEDWIKHEDIQWII